MNRYQVLRAKSLTLAFLSESTGTERGRISILIGKNVIVIPPMYLSNAREFFCLTILKSLNASRFVQINLYLLMNIAVSREMNKTLNKYVKIAMYTYPRGLVKFLNSWLPFIASNKSMKMQYFSYFKSCNSRIPTIKKIPIINPKVAKNLIISVTISYNMTINSPNFQVLFIIRTDINPHYTTVVEIIKVRFS